MKISTKKIINSIGNPKIFVISLIWLMLLLILGTLAQRDLGLYLAQKKYFSNWLNWIGFIPIPSARIIMLVIFINLSTYFLRPGIFKVSKIGITITHFGALLLLFGGALTAVFSYEGMMVIDEGSSNNYIHDYFDKEFLITDTSNKNYDEVVVFNQNILFADNQLTYNSIPFEISIIAFFENCKPVKRDTIEVKYHGLAQNFYLEPIKPEKEFEKNISGLIINISGINNQENGIYMIYEGQPIPQTITANNNRYILNLRHKRTFLPFHIELIDFKKILHPGTEIPKSFSSEVNIIENKVPRRILIEMNKPLRHGGYTFYQSSFVEKENLDTTVLAVVKNYGRLFPYISSIIMSAGILIHIINNLSRRFIKK